MDGPRLGIRLQQLAVSLLLCLFLVGRFDLQDGLSLVVFSGCLADDLRVLVPYVGSHVAVIDSFVLYLCVGAVAHISERVLL